MGLKKYAIIAALGTTAIVPAQQAHALFGLTCIPRLQNCMCTYLKPCPVIDVGANVLEGNIKNSLKRQEDVTKDITKQWKDISRTTGADLGGLLPGLDSISLDIDGLIQDQVDQITNAIQGIQEQIQGIAVAAGDIQNILAGGLDATQIMNSIEESGLNALDLQNLGISPDAINGLINGTLNPQQLLDVAGGLNFQGDVLNQLGITPDAITSIVNGQMQFGDLENILSQANLDISDLSSLGIDLSQLEQIAGSMDLTAGLNIINELGVGGLDISSQLGTIEGIISGSLDSSQIFDLANSVGLNIPELQQLGISPETIAAFQNGGFSASQLLEIAGPLGLRGPALEGLGIDSEAILSIANGSLSPDQFLEMAQGVGLSINDLSSIGLSYSDIVNMAQSGNMTSALALLENAGIGTNPLQGIGLSASDIAAFANGDISPAQLSSMLQSAGIDPSRVILPGIDGTIVNGLGEIVDNFENTINFPIDSITGLRDALDQAQGIGNQITALSADEILSSLSGQIGVNLQSQDFMNALISGNASSAQLISLLNSNGLGVDQLQAIGVSIDSINALTSGAFNANELLDFSQSLGLGSQAFEGLGLGSNALQSIASGQLSPQSFMQNAAALGITPETLSANGISAEALNQIATSGSTEIAQQVADAAAGAPGNAISVPLAGGSPLAQVASQNASPGFSGPSCTDQQTLLTSNAPPNFFGDDVAAIDFQLSQGDIHLHEEAISDAMGLASVNQAQVLARSIQVKSILTDALGALDSLRSEIENSPDQDEDIRINDTVKLQLMMAQAEVASLYTYLASTKAAANINKTIFTETGTFPHGSDFEQYITETAGAAAEETSALSAATLSASKEYSDFRFKAGDLTYHYDLNVRSNQLTTAAQGLEDNIAFHEMTKSHLYMLEQRIRTMAEPLYHNPHEATEALLRDLKSAAGEYGPESRWNTSNNTAMSLQGAFLATNSRYGQRVIIESQDSDMPDTPAQPAQQPYNYPQIDNASQDDPYDIIRPAQSGGGRDEEAPPPPPLVGLFQYYLEAFRREAYNGEFRRGAAPNTMTLQAWEEFTEFDIQCLQGPIEATIENVAIRPDVFDLSPTCTHLTWEGGDTEDYIPPTNMGGTDAILWSNKIRRDRILLQTGGPQNVLDQTQATLNEITQSNIMQELLDLGMEGRAADLQEKIDSLEAILEDTTFTQTLPNP